jgi:carboxypeptidase C (cathepsin A)
VSTLTNYGTVRPDKSNPIPVALNLPTMAATAWYHKKLSANWQKQPIKKVVDASRDFMYETLIPGLVKGTAMTPEERKKVVNGVAEFTGLSKDFVDRGDGKVSLSQFYTELLRSDRLSVGRLDGRFTGYLRNGNSLSPDYDASNTGITGPFTSCMNEYVRNELGYKTNNKYFVLGEGLTAPWKFGDGIADTSESLRRAISKNSFMNVLYAMGYYDFATPFAATEFGVNQMELDKRLLGNLSYTFYEAGHMMYIHDESRKKLTADVIEFMRKSMK